MIYVFYRESVVTPDNLYSSIDNVLIDNGIEFGNGLNVQNFMSNWTTQAGYPILDIKKNKTANKYLLTQVIIHYSINYNLFIFMININYERRDRVSRNVYFDKRSTFGFQG